MQGNNKNGEPCGAAATPNGYCHFHSDPEAASRAGRQGGRQNRHFVDSTARPLPPLDSGTGVRSAIASIIEDVYAGRGNAKRAILLAPLFNTLLRALGSAELEERVKKLESKADTLSPKTPPDGGEGEGGQITA